MGWMALSFKNFRRSLLLIANAVPKTGGLAWLPLLFNTIQTIFIFQSANLNVRFVF